MIRVVLSASATAMVWCLSTAVTAQPAPQATSPTAQTSVARDRLPADTTYTGRYRLTPSDVIEIAFPYVAEFNQVVTVQPDGYVTLRAAGEVRVQGRTVPELVALLGDAYAPILRDPVITVVLKEFEKPHFIAAGELKTPGRFDLRGATTVTEAIAVAGGFTSKARESQVVLFRRYSDDLLEVKQIDVKKMLASRDLSEDHLIRPGDTLYVPRSRLSRLGAFIPSTGLGIYLDPLRR